MSPLRRVYTDGIYDLFHRGHVESFKQIKELYPHYDLVVGVVNDLDATGYKRAPIYSEEDRYCLVESCRYVDELVRDAPLIMTEEFLLDNKIDLVVHGFSNPADSEKQAEFFRVPISLGKFQEVPYYDKISSSDIIRKIKEV